MDSLTYTLPMETTKVYAKDGTLLQEYGAEKRILVPFTEISPSFFDALIAVEDANFYKHHGISIKGIIRAIVRDITQRKAGQGGSTITMQLARQYFLTPEKTITRKIKEIILSLKIEKRYTKQQILEMYANKVCFGHGYYGIEAASRFYFGKKAISLSVEESAFLAGVIQRPTYYSPKKYPERAKERRDWVLSRMVKTGKLSEQEYEKIVKKPIKLAVSAVEKGIGAYPAERVRIYLESKYSEEDIYEKGFKVYTTIDPQLQAVAVNAVKEGLKQYQRRRPYRGPKRGNDARLPSEDEEIKEGQSFWARVEKVYKDGIEVYFCGKNFKLNKDNFKWYPSITPNVVFKEGDSVLINVVKKEPLELQLDDLSEAQS
ncbi:MAG: transglycosylase domain-containing protein, partial [Acidobacteria bacterium]|nr:transglycosylase domain-containing protein [Acidobacteriota bacterium]